MGLFKKKDKPKKSTEEIIRETIEKEKNKMIDKKRAEVQIPYTKSGVNDALLGSLVFGKNGLVLGSLNEGSVSWKWTKLLFQDNGLYVKETGQVILYEDIKQVVIGDKSFLRTMMTILTNSGEGVVLKAGHYVVKALKEVIESYIPEKSNADNVADELLKYGELLERGLITQEEFDMKKAELMGNHPVNDSETKIQNENYSLKQEFSEQNDITVEDVPKFCSNCGTPIDTDSNFCTNCGNKLK